MKTSEILFVLSNMAGMSGELSARLESLEEDMKAESELADKRGEEVLDLRAQLANMHTASESLLQTIEAERAQHREKAAELERQVVELQTNIELMEKASLRMASDHAETLARVSGDRVRYEDEIRDLLGAHDVRRFLRARGQRTGQAVRDSRASRERNQAIHSQALLQRLRI